MSAAQLLLLSLLSLTLSLSAHAAEQCSYGIRDFGRDFLNAANFTAGNVDSCNTNPDGSFNVSCEEVEKADREGFSSGYDYVHDANNNDYVNCTRINAPEILERLQLQDMAKATAEALNCNLSFLNIFDLQPGNPEVVRLKKAARDAFILIQEDLRKNLSDKSTAASSMSLHRSTCHREPGDGGILPLHCTSREALDTEQQQRVTISRANSILDTIIATVPYGTEVEMREAIIASANADPDTFVNNYSAALIAVRARLLEFQERLEATKRDIVVDGGEKVGVYLNSDQCNTPYMLSTFFASDQYNTLVNARNISPRLKQIMTCRRDQRKIGAARVYTGLMVASVATMAITGGASVAGVTVSAAAKTAMVVADLGISGIGLVVGIPAIYENCYNNGTAIVRGGDKCSPTDGLNMAITRTTNAMCALSVISTASSGGYIVGQPLMSALRARKAAAAAREETVSPPPPQEPQTPTQASDNEIVVTGIRKKH